MKSPFLCVVALVIQGFSLPQNPVVVSGSAELSEISSQVFQISAGDQVEIHWKDFSVGVDERVHFIQPSNASVALNRVLEAYPSQLLGKIEANGQVLLINPNGILVGKDAEINVGSLIASTLDLKSYEFSKEYAFEGLSDARIVNLGKIRALDGDALLIGFQVENHGSIESMGGLAAVVATNQVLLKPLEQQRIFIAAKEVGDSIYSSAFSHPTDPDALEIDGERLCQAIVSGTMISKGGQVDVFGDQVWIKEGARLDVSSDFGGGTVLIGGDYQGLNLDVPNAKRTLVDQTVEIDASALEVGDGGKVVVWSDEATAYFGTILADGGKKGGDGGVVEISSLRALSFDGVVRGHAPLGKMGRLLLDPNDIQINAAPTNPPGTFPPSAPFFDGAGVAAATLDAAALATALTTMSVVVQTSLATAGGSGDINVFAPVLWGPAVGTRLTLNASGTINILANVLESSAAPFPGGAVVLIAQKGLNVLSNGNGREAFVGSRDGLTIVGDPSIPDRCNRSHPTVQVESGPGFVAGACSRIGFKIPPGGTATGAIDVTCGSLTVAANPASIAAIGHGDNNFTAGFPNTMSTTNAATITVDASGTIKITALGQDTLAEIGHASFLADTGSNFQGDICVTGASDIQITVPNPSAGASVVKAGIGHGNSNGAFIDNLSGDISVFANGNLIIDVRDSLNGVASIGHFSAGNTSTVIGDIFVSALKNIVLSATNAPLAGSTNCHAFIGHDNLVRVPILSAACSISVSAGGNICLKTGTHRSRAGIGVRATNLTGIVSVSAGGNLSAINENDSSNNIFRVYIGHESSNALLSTSPTFIAVAGSIFLGDSLGGTNCCPPVGTNCMAPSGFSKQIVIQAPGDVNVAAGGDILGIGTDNFGPFRSFISTQNDAGGFTRIFAGGSMQGLTWPGGSSFLLGIDNFAATSSSIDFRAGNSILMPNSFVTGGTGGAFLGATTSFATSQLWTSNSNQLITVCEQTVPLLSLTNCSACPPVFPAVFVAAISPQIAAAPCGTLPGANILIQTTNGPITLSNPTFPTPPATPVDFCSTCNQCQTLTIGVVPPNSIQIATVTGDITISTFNDIVINQNITTAGPGKIDIEACQDCIVSPPFLVSATGTGSVELAAGRDLVLTGTSVLTDSGSICLSAFRDAHINETVQSTSGTITTLAGRNINMPSSLVQTSNAILMIAGQSLIMTGTADISSTGSTVTIVVDNNFPAAPLIGPGALLMDPTAEINAIGTIRVFSALSNLNNIAGLLTVNGAPLSFTPSSQLYIDTDQEVWCTYVPQPLFGCSLIGCGIFPAFLGTSSTIPLTVFYKDCLQQTMQQAVRIVDEFLTQMHPYNEYPGWVQEFWIEYAGLYKRDFLKKSMGKNSSLDALPDEPYYHRRRHLNMINHPKTWTVWWQ